MRHASPLALLSVVLLVALSSNAVQADLAAVAGNTNIAAAANGGRIVTFSSEALDENGKPIPEWQASNLIDGKYVVGSYTPADSYGWSSQGPPSDERPQWVILGFADPHTGKDVTRLISRIVIDPTTDDPPLIGRWVQGFTLQTSTTDPKGPWKTIGMYAVVNRPVKQTFDFPPTEARYVRILVTSNHGSDRTVEMGEVEIYEAIVPGEQLSQLIIRLENLLDDLKRYRDGQLYQQQQRTASQTGQKPPPEAQPGGPAPQPPAALPPPATPVPERVSLGALSVLIPTGWERYPDFETGEQVKLFLLGPKTAGTATPAFTVSVESVREGTTLAGFAADVAGRLAGASSLQSRSDKLGEVPAHFLALKVEDRVYLEYCLLHEGQGLVLTGVVPLAVWNQDQGKALLQPLWDGIKLGA